MGLKHMVCVISCALSMVGLVLPRASSFPLKPQWAAEISGNNGGDAVEGTFRWDSTTGVRFPKFELHWKLSSSWYAAQGFQDSMGVVCSFSDDQICTKSFRQRCSRRPDPTRTVALVELLMDLHENGTHDGECSHDTSAADSQLWSVNRKGVGNLSMCLTPFGFPVAMASNPDKNLVGTSNVDFATFRFLFRNVTLGPQRIEEPACQECAQGAAVAPCPGEGILSMEVMRMTNGGGEPLDQIWNLDMADIPGEIMFNHSLARKYLKVFNVSVNSSWGPMRDCNFLNGENHIEPAQDERVAKLVARGDAEGFNDPCGGQCSKNEFGSYYAFPKEGRCPEGVPVGTEGCSWQVKSVKVVSIECVKSAGLFAAAASNDYGHKPWSAMQASIRKGVAECPDIRSLSLRGIHTSSRGGQLASKRRQHGQFLKQILGPYGASGG